MCNNFCHKYGCHIKGSQPADQIHRVRVLQQEHLFLEVWMTVDEWELSVHPAFFTQHAPPFSYIRQEAGESGEEMRGRKEENNAFPLSPAVPEMSVIN